LCVKPELKAKWKFKETLIHGILRLAKTETLKALNCNWTHSCQLFFLSSLSREASIVVAEMILRSFSFRPFFSCFFGAGDLGRVEYVYGLKFLWPHCDWTSWKIATVP